MRSRHTCSAVRWPRWLAGFARAVMGGALAALLALFSVPMVVWAVDSSAALEFKVKAGYLFNFAKFVEWPDTAFPSADSPFIIAVLDGSEAQPVIEQILAGKNINGR